MYWFYRLALNKYGRKTAERAVIYLSIYPFSFFFGAIMTESLFFLTTSASLYYISKHKWLRAGVWGILASMTRMYGLLLIAAAITELIEHYRPFISNIEDRKIRIKNIFKRIPLILLPVMGTIIYLILNYHVDKNVFAFMKHQKHWYQSFIWIGDTLYYIIKNSFHYPDLSSRVSIWIPELLLFLIFSVIFALALKNRKNSTMLLLYGFLYIILTYSLSWLLSAGRYMLCSHVFFIFLADHCEERPKLNNLIIIISSALLGIYLFAFTLGKSIM